MNTVFKSNSGFWEAKSSKSDASIPQGRIRLSMLRLEVVEIGDEVDLDTQFTILAAMEDESPEHRRLLLSLRDHLVQNFGAK